MSAFDATDLRMRVQSSFSAPEMRRLLEGWGASPSEIEADAASLAHHVVRIGGKRFGLAEMLRRLQAEKPLTEWPDPVSDEERWAGPVSLPGTQPVDEDATTCDPPLPPPAPDPGPSPEPGAPEIAVQEVALQAAPASQATPAPQAHPPARPAGLMYHQPSPAPAGRSIEPRLALVAGAAVLGLVLLAFGAGLLWQARAQPASSQASAEGDATPPRSSGAAGRAATTFEDSLRQVAEVCALDINGLPSRDVLELAQQACGRDEFQRQEEARLKELAGNPEYQPYRPAARPSPVEDEDEDHDEQEKRPAPPPRPRADMPPRATPPPGADPLPRLDASTPGCGTCSKKRTACAKDCGPEPQDASLYDAFQACSGRCVAQESRCRLSCR